MGACFSKKSSSSSPPPAAAASAASFRYAVADSSDKSRPKLEVEAADPRTKAKKAEIEVEEQGGRDQETQVHQVKKEVFIIKHRKSHDERAHQQNPPEIASEIASPPPQIAAAAAASDATAPSELGDGIDNVSKRVRTQSCNKEDLDAILIQCGRLSRSNSSGNVRKYSGSKRSYDFDATQDDGNVNVNGICHDGGDGGGGLDADDDRVGAERTRRHRQSSRPSSPSSQGRRRRTPSRERNQQQQQQQPQQQRSSSRERRTSRSPAKRSSSPSLSSQQNASLSSSKPNANANASHRPGKMVSVPAAAISSANNNNNGESAAPKRVSVKRNVGSPRCQSPARANARGAPNDGQQQQQQQPTLSRSSSRKAEHSPCRRNPLAEIDPNTLVYPQAHNNRTKKEGQTEEEIVLKEPTNFSKQVPTQKPTLEFNNNRIAPQVVNYITSTTDVMDNNKAMSANCSSKELHQQNIVVEEAKGQAQGKPQTLTRSRSSRRSRDLDIDPETATLLSPAPSLYTSLLLQDIQNFHQHSTTNAVSLPPCVTKACSILEAVADLNSATKSAPTDQINKKTGYNCSMGTNYNLVEKSIVGAPKDPFVESEVNVNNDLTEPSFHKYVTVRRGTSTLDGEIDMEDQESSGSNSFVSGSSRSQQHHWGLSSSSWEPNSVDSTDCWTSRSHTREEDHKTPLSLDMDEAARRRLGGRKRDSDDHPQRSSGIGRGRLGVSNTKGLHTVYGVAAAASM